MEPWEGRLRLWEPARGHCCRVGSLPAAQPSSLSCPLCLFWARCGFLV